MLRVGLTGGLASGKSFVGKALRSFGAHVIDADAIGHQVLAPDGAAYAEVVAEFGSSILSDSGEIDRKQLAAQVFGAPERLERLNALVHPRVIALEEQYITQAEREDPRGIAIVEAAILIETGSYKRFDKLILVWCTPEQQIERAMRRDGCTLEEARARVARQMPLEDKRKFADYVIDTSGAKERTIEQTRGVYEALRRFLI